MENKTNKKIDISFIITTVLLLAVIIGFSVFGIITFARYRTIASGGTEARIAKWSFKVNGEEEFFSTINLADTIDFTEVEKGKIAPGTNGSFNLIIDGSGSEVSLDYYINLDIIHKPHNMKFYLDSAHTTELPVTADNKILLEDEILLSNINTPITQIIYWDWAYRTNVMPSEDVLTEYGLNKADIDAQIAAASTQEERENIIKLTNDKIDTQDEGGEVLISASIKGVQKNPLGFVQKGIRVTSDTSVEYTTGDEITFEVEFTEGVYADANKTPITEQTAPVLTFEFVDDDETENANSLISKVASLENIGIKFAEETSIVRQAEFVSAENNKINYRYIVQSEDKGILKVKNFTGQVYNKNKHNIQVEKEDIDKVKVAYLSDGILLLNSTFNNGKVRDEVLREDYVVNGDAVNSSSVVKNGSGSMYFSGAAGERLRLNRNELNFGTHDFTIEFWLYPEEQVNTLPVIFSDEANANFELILKDSENGNNITLRGSDNSRSAIINTGVQYKANQWNQYKITRKKGEFKIYENGRLIGSTLEYKTMNVNLSNLAIGGNSSTATSSYKGYIDDFKIYSIATEEYLSTTTPNELISVGGTYKMNVQNTESSTLFWNKRFSNSDFVWTSSNVDIARVDSAGNVTGVSVGTSTITGYNSEYGLRIRGIVNVKNVNAVAIPQVIVGEGYTIALKEDGTVWSVGKNTNGVLGNGTNNDSVDQEQVVKEDGSALTGVRKISSGCNFAMALTTNGEVYAWGENGNGQLAIGSTAASNCAKKAKISENEYAQNIIDISCGDYGAGIIDSNKRLYISGRDDLNQHLNKTGQTSYFVANGIDNVVSVDGGYSCFAVMSANGQSIAWGHNYYGAIESNPDRGDEYIVANNAVHFELNGYMGAYINEDGDVYASGLNNVGNLALGDTNNRAVYTKVQIPENKKAKYISGGANNLVIQTKDNTVYVAGYNGNGQLCTGNTSNVTTLTELTGASNVLKLGDFNEAYYRGTNINLAIIKEDGTAWISGDNSYGQYGNGAENIYSLVQYGTDFLKLNARNEYIKVGQTLDINITECSRFNLRANISSVDQNEWIWESSNEDVATVNSSTGVVTGVSMGYTTITGRNSSKNIKVKAIINVYRNVEGVITYPQIGEGEGFTVVLKEDGTVWAAGKNDTYQLGDGTTANRNTFEQVKIDANTNLTNVRKISVSQCSTIALTADGKVYGWGSNNYGSFGIGNSAAQSYAVKVKGIDGQGELSNIIDVCTSWWNSYFVDNSGAVLGVGNNDCGQLTSIGGVRNTVGKMPDFKNAIKCETGYQTIAIMKSNSDVCIKGENQMGCFGNGRIEYIGGSYVIGNDINDISIVGFVGLIIKEDGYVYVSGYNNCGQLGTGNTSNRGTYEKLKLQDGTEIRGKYAKAGNSNNIVTGLDGKVYAVGYNGNGQISGSVSGNVYYPICIKDISGVDIQNVFMANIGFCAWNTVSSNIEVIKNDGTIWMSGDNTYGQFGDGTNTSANYMKQVGNLNLRINARNEYIKVGQTYDINVTECSTFISLINTQAINQNEWTWESSNTDVATVDSSTGVVTGVSMGYTTIIGRNASKNLKVKAIINVYRNVEGAITYPQIGEGEGFTVVLKEDGTVWAAGKNNAYQLGDGTTSNRNTFEQVKIDANTNLTNVRKISVSQTSIIALTADGKVYGWGSNDYSAFGLGNSTAQSYAVKVKGIDGQGELDNIIDISTSWLNSYFINNNGDVLGVGHNELGQMTSAGGARNTVGKMYDFKDAIKCEAGYQTVAIIKSNSETWIKGENQKGNFGNGVITGAGGSYLIGNDINEISVVGYNGLIVKEDATVYVSGYNNCGQLGNGNTTNRSSYQKLTLQNGTEIKAKYARTCNSNNIIAGIDGKVYAVGYNGNGQISGSVSGNVSYPICIKDINGNDIQNVYMANIGDCHWYGSSTNIEVIKNDGTIWMSGDNANGQFGDGTNTGANYMKQVGSLNLKINARNEYIKVGQTYDNNVTEDLIFNSLINTQEINQNEWTWESSNIDVATVDSSTGVVTGVSMGYTTIIGRNTSKGLKVKAIINVYRNVNGAITYPQIGEGQGFTIVLKEDGTVWGSGVNSSNQLGDGTTTSRNTFEQVKIDENTNLTNVRKISVSQYTTVALTVDGKVYSWGSNVYGVLGPNVSLSPDYAVKMADTTGEADLTNIIDVVTSGCNSYFINNQGDLYAIGTLNQCGQMNSAGGARSTVGIMSDFKDVIKCEAGYQTVAIIKSNSEVWVKGENSHGNFGTSTSANPYFIGTDINDISIVGYGGILIKEDKSVYVSGYNNCGQLGTGNTSDRGAYEKLTLQNGTEIKGKYAKTSNSNNIVLGLDGKIYAVGYNGYGQISGSVSGNVYYPICIKDNNGTDIQNVLIANIGDCAYNTVTTNMEAIKTDGTIWMSGDNTYGQFGDGTNTSANYMKQVGIDFNVFTQNTVAMIMMLNNLIDNMF